MTDVSARVPVRVGLVGAGGVGVRHAATLAAVEGAHLVAVTDVDAARARVLAERYGARLCPDLDALLEAELDVVWLCLPPFAHGAPERAVLDSGLPFFVEKPLAAELGTAEAVAAEVERRGTLTATGYHWRYMPGMERAAQVFAATPVLLASGAWLDKVPPVPWWSRRDLSGGQLIEQATHLTDSMRALIGPVESVQAHAAAVPDREPDLVDVATAATIRFVSGAVATLAVTSALRWKHAASLSLVGEGVSVEIGEVDTVVRHGTDRVEIVPDAGAAKLRVVEDFCAAVRSGDGSGVRVPYAEALKTHRVGCALAESARTGTVIRLEDSGG